jgi:hypothetical protein
MPDFNVRSDAVNVEQIMEQIRARIREKRGVDYTEDEIRELASVKLEKFLDPRGVRSDLLEQFRRAQPLYAPPELPNYEFEADTLFTSTRGPLRFIRRLLLPVLKLFFNPNPLIQALNIQSKLNASAAEREATRDAARFAFDQLHYEVMHNLVIETTRLGIEVKNLKMRLESFASRLEFNERRARALESVVVYKPANEDRPARQDEGRREEGRRDDQRREDARRQESRRPAPPPRAPQPSAAPTPSPEPADLAPPAPEGAAPVAQGEPAAGVPEGPGQKSRRRRRRRGRRGGGSAAALMGGGQSVDAEESQEAAHAGSDEGDFGAEPSEQPGSDHDLEQSADSRSARPELFEHAFGAQAHPSEPAVKDPAPTPAASTGATQAEPAPTQEPTSADPSATPEQ